MFEKKEKKKEKGDVEHHSTAHCPGEKGLAEQLLILLTSTSH